MVSRGFSLFPLCRVARASLTANIKFSGLNSLPPKAIYKFAHLHVDLDLDSQLYDALEPNRIQSGFKSFEKIVNTISDWGNQTAEFYFRNASVAVAKPVFRL